MALTDKLTAIADAIRAKGGTTDLLTLDGMVGAINAIEAGGGGGGPFSDVTLLSTIEVPEDVSAIQIDWKAEWNDYNFIAFRPNAITLSVSDWLYLSSNDTAKSKYIFYSIKVISENYSFGFLKNASDLSIDNRFRGLAGTWGGTTLNGAKGEEISYLYLQPYGSNTLIKSGSKIDVLGVNFA